MKNLTQEQITAIVNAIGGDEVRVAFTPLPIGSKIKLENLTVVPASDQNGANGEVVHINEWVRADFVRVDNEQPAGSASLRSILISPEITWAADKSTQTDRIKALMGAPELDFTFMESKVSKSTGNPYKVAHFQPITL